MYKFYLEIILSLHPWLLCTWQCTNCKQVVTDKCQVQVINVQTLWKKTSLLYEKNVLALWKKLGCERMKRRKKGEIYIFSPNYTDRRRAAPKKRKNIVNQSKFGQDEMGKNTKKKESFTFWTKRPRLGFWGCLWRQMKSRSSQAGILSHLVGGFFLMQFSGL